MRQARLAATGILLTIAFFVGTGIEVLGTEDATSLPAHSAMSDVENPYGPHAVLGSAASPWSGHDEALFAVVDAVTPAPGPIQGWLDGRGFDVARFRSEMSRVMTVPTHFAPAPPVVAARPTQVAERTAPKVSAAAAVVIDEDSAAVLFGKNEDERRAPASLTKVATAALAVQSGALDETVHNTVDSARMPGSSLMGLKPGDEFSLRDLLYGLILPSGNDAAIAIGRYLGDGSDAAFMYQVNALFESLGLDGSHFTDPHGLGGRYHYTTATELALLSRYAMQFPEFRNVVAARSWTAEGSRTIQLSNLNPFMDVYPGADGLKTGYTEVAGPTFIGSAERDGRRLYVVLLNSQDRFGEASALLDWAFETYDWSEADPARGMRTILNEGDLP